MKSKFQIAFLRNDVKNALVKLGFKPPQAGAAVDQALERVGTNVELTVLIREALKCCPKGRG
jgi:Holliday junction resolvasome RuvABC DNA-binding subunit